MGQEQSTLAAKSEVSQDVSFTVNIPQEATVTVTVPHDSRDSVPRDGIRTIPQNISVTIPQDFTVTTPQDVTTVTINQDASIFKTGDVSETNVLAVRERSRSVSPAGLRNRKVELKDGYLVVSEKDTDSACSSVMGDMIDEWENVYMKHRDDIIGENGFISTPLHCVKQLAAKLKMDVHIEHYILDGQDLKTNKTLYRVDILMGELRGSGQCTRKQLARQLAAIDVYEKLQLQQTDLGFRPTPMPRCALLPGWRVDKIVFPTLFNEVCKQQDLGTPIFKLIPPPGNYPGKFIAICKVGGTVTRGENDHPWLAKRLAAKEMYQAITGNEFQLEATPMGCDVLGFPRMRLLGFDPQITNLKRKWMMENRIQDTQIVVPADEPDDGEMADVEEEFRNQQSKKLKICVFPENFKITVNNKLEQKAVQNLKVIAVNDKAAGPSDMVRKFVAYNNTISEGTPANLKVTILSESNNLKKDNDYNAKQRQVVQPSSSAPMPSTSGFHVTVPNPNYSSKQESMQDDDDGDFDYGDFNTSDEDALLS